MTERDSAARGEETRGGLGGSPPTPPGYDVGKKLRFGIPRGGGEFSRQFTSGFEHGSTEPSGLLIESFNGKPEEVCRLTTSPGA